MCLTSQSRQRRARSMTAALIGLSAAVLVLSALVGSAQTTPPPEPVGQPSSVDAPRSARPDPGSGTLPQETPASPSPVAPNNAQDRSIELLGQRIDALAQAVRASTETAKAPEVDRWQDAKSVFLNVLSNRIDAWLFGEGNESVGLAAQVVATVALVIALIRFMLAVAMLNPATPPTLWGKFKAWTRKSSVVRGLDVVIGALAVIFTGAALYVVVSARASSVPAQESIITLQEALSACQTTLTQTSVALPKDAPARTVDRSAIEAMAGYARTCEAAFQGADARLIRIEGSMSRIDGKQPWAVTKFIAFLTSLYLIAGMTYLLAVRG